MEPENGPLEKEIPIWKPSFPGSMLILGVVYTLCLLKRDLWIRPGRKQQGNLTTTHQQNPNSTNVSEFPPTYVPFIKPAKSSTKTWWISKKLPLRVRVKSNSKQSKLTRYHQFQYPRNPCMVYLPTFIMSFSQM